MQVPAAHTVRTMLSTMRGRFLFLLTVVGCISVINSTILNQQNEYENIQLYSSVKQAYSDNKYDYFENSIGMKLVALSLGEFLMGYSETPLPYNLTEGRPYRTNGDFDEQPWHNVQITKPIHMSAFEVTNAQYRLFDPDHVTDEYGFSWNGTEAVVMVSYYDAVEFCEWLSDVEGVIYRLPTEAEWEYAARANTKTYFYMGDEFPEDEGKFQQTSWLPGRREDGDVVALTVGMFPPNDFGLYDMHGNVEEWTSDWYGPYSAEDQVDPVGPASGSFRVTRGGSHSTVPYYLRSANRMGALPSDKSWYIGFRVVLDKSAPMDYWSKQREIMQQASQEQLPRAEVPHPRPSFQSDEPFLKVLQYVHVSPNSTVQPPFKFHNHDPAVMPLPNGDVFAIWYTCYSESERELAVAFSRLPANGTHWEEAKLFWDTPDRNDHAPGLFFDNNTNTLYHYTSLCAAATWGSPAVIMRQSHDFGYTWSAARFLMPEHELRHMVVETIFATRTGVWVMPCDDTTYGSGGTAVHLSYDHGVTWEDTGNDVLGIHGAILERDDGSFYAVGRGDDIDGSLARSISHDMGYSWTYGPTGLPGIISYQRAVVLHLAEGPLLYIGFSPSYMSYYDADYDMERRVTGMFTALSYDEGDTWTDHKLISHYTLGSPLQTLDGRYFLQSWKMAEPQGYLSARQHSDGVIHLISSRQHYRFNYEWLIAPAAVPPQSDFHAILDTTPLTIAQLDSATGHLISTTVVNAGIEGDIVGSYHNYLSQELFVWTYADNNTVNPTFWVVDSENYTLKRSWEHVMPKLTLARPQIAAKINQHGTVIYVVSSNEIVLPNILVQQLNDNGKVTKEQVAYGDPDSISTPVGLFAETSNTISDNNLWIPVSCYSPIMNTIYYTLIWVELNSDYSELHAYVHPHEWWTLMFYDPLTNHLYFTVTDPRSDRSVLLFYNGDATQFEHEFPGIVTPCASYDEVSLTWLLGCDTVYSYDTLSHNSVSSFAVSSPAISSTYFGYHYSN